MQAPIASADPESAGFHLLPPAFGILIAPWRLSSARFWFRSRTIEHLIRLASIRASADATYGQVEEYRSRQEPSGEAASFSPSRT